MISFDYVVDSREITDIFEIEKIHEHKIEEIFRKTATTSFEIDFLKRVLQM